MLATTMTNEKNRRMLKFLINMFRKKSSNLEKILRILHIPKMQLLFGSFRQLPSEQGRRTLGEGKMKNSVFVKRLLCFDRERIMLYQLCDC